MSDTISHSIFHRYLNHTVPIQVPDITVEGKTYTQLRTWQQEAFTQLKDERQVLIQAATGAGKSVTMMMLAAYKMAQNPAMRTICSVSYKDIGKGFSKAFNHIVDGKEISLQVEKNIACNDADEQGKIKAIIDFMELKNVSGMSIGEKILICTHASLVAAKKRREDLFTNIKDFTSIVDETHHSSSQAEEYNGLAGVIHDVMSEPSNQLILATATFMRGDNNNIVNEELTKQLKTYKFALDKHLENAIYLKHFDMAVSLCNSSDASVAEIKNLCNNDKNTIIWIPHTNSLNSLGYPSKDTLVAAIIKGIKEVRGDSAVISDWVTGRNENEEHALPDMKTFKGVLIAMNRFKEGSDWEAAEQGIVLGERGSLPDLIQMYGRLFRDYPGKESIHMHQILPCRFGRISAESEEFKEEVNNHWKVICSLMLMEDIFAPLVLRDKKEKDEKGEGKIRTNYLNDITKSDSQKKELSDWFNDQILQLAAEKDSDGSLSKEELMDLASEAVTKFDLQDADSELLAEYMCKRWKPKRLVPKGLNPADVDFDFLLNVQDIADKVGSKDIGFITLSEYRSFLFSYENWDWTFFIKKSKEVHGDKFTYPDAFKIDFPGCNFKVNVFCCTHGLFQQTSYHHINSKFGCIGCSGKAKKSLEDMISSFKEKHFNKYDYSKITAPPTSLKEKVQIICKEHGEFSQAARDHANGRGCAKCVDAVKQDAQYYINKFNLVHNYKYDYSETDFSKNRDFKINVKCNTHGIFEITKSNHLRHGCNKCGYDVGKKTHSETLKNKRSAFYDEIERASPWIKIQGDEVIKSKTSFIGYCKFCKIAIRGEKRQLIKHTKCIGCKANA